MISNSSFPPVPIRFKLGGSSPITVPSMVAFGAAFDARLVADEGACGSASNALIVIGESSCNVAQRVLPARTLIAPAVQGGSGVPIEAIEIAKPLPGKCWMRGQSIRFPAPVRIVPLDAPPGAEIIASSPRGPVWVRETHVGGVIDRVAVPFSVPELRTDRPVYECLTPETFPSLLPMVQFLREVTGACVWDSPLRACFMFDDPNLHAATYGFIKFAELAAEAEQHGYHVSFATVPLDTWYTSSKASAIFRAHKDALSLLIHGNDHVRQELGREYPKEAGLALLSQALRRISRLEAKSGLKVCRIMAAPHGLCSEDMMSGMGQLRYSAACVSNGSLRARARPKALGARPVEIMAGLPVIPRFQLGADNDLRVLIAAYLDQPIIPTGHHQDVASSLELLNRVAIQIGRVGAVQWMPMSRIAESLYQWRREGETFVVRPYSRMARLTIPKDATRLRVEPHPSNRFEAVHYSIMRNDQGSSIVEIGECITVAPGERILLSPCFEDVLDPVTIPVPRWKPGRILRRIACEGRDRVAPWIFRA